MPKTIGPNDAQYAHDLVKTICEQVGPGLPGSPQERARAAVIRKELESHLGAGNVTVEEFTVAPDAFLASLPLSAAFMLIAALLNISIGRLTGMAPWLTAMLALAFSIVAALLVILEFVLGLEFIDRFFRKKQSINVIGTLRKPGTTDGQRLLILSGHHDSALENTWLSLFGYGFLIGSAIWLIGLVTLFAISLIQLIGVIIGDAGIVGAGTLNWILLVFPLAPSIIFAAFFNRGRQNGGTVPGAVDNLSGSALTVALCRFLTRNPANIPGDTEIRFISFGSEEAGVRGSRRYVARHLDELKRRDTRVLNFEMVAHPEIAILASDVNGTLKYSPEMVKSAVAAAERARVPYKVQSTFFGGPGTDGASFAQAGLKATTLLPFQMPQQLVAFYHQESDRPENLTLEPLLNVLKLSCEWIRGGGE